MSLDANYGIARPVEGGGAWGAAAPPTILSFHSRQASLTPAVTWYFGFVSAATPQIFVPYVSLVALSPENMTKTSCVLSWCLPMARLDVGSI